MYSKLKQEPTPTLTDLVKQLLSCSVWLDGKLQLCIHSNNSNIDLRRKNKKHCLRLTESCFLVLTRYFVYHTVSTLRCTTVTSLIYTLKPQLDLCYHTCTLNWGTDSAVLSRLLCRFSYSKQNLTELLVK